MKRTIILFAVIVLLVATWSAAWFFVEGKVAETADRVVERLAQRGQQLNCAERQTGGYPFRISFTCQSLEYRNNIRGLFVETGELRSAAQAYQPGKVVVEVDSPAQLSLAGSQPIDVSWNTMRSSLFATLDGLDRFSVVGTEIEFIPAGPNSEETTVRKLQLHGRRLEGDTVQLAMRSEQIVSNLERWPEFDANILLSLDEAYAALLRRPDIVALGRAVGLKGELQALEYNPVSGGGLMLSGPISVSRNGLISGDFKLKIVDASKLLSALQVAIPNYQNQLQQLSAALALLPPNSDDSTAVTVPLRARDGRLSVGLLPVGVLPPIY